MLLSGCQSQTPYNTGKPATNWNPFAGWGQTRVPPPGTNQYGTSSVAPAQGFTVPPGTPFGPLPPGATAPGGAAPFNGVRGGAVAPGPGAYGPGAYGAPQTNLNPNTTNPTASAPGSLGPAQASPIRRASFEDPASAYPQNAVQPVGGESLSRSQPAPAAKITPY